MWNAYMGSATARDKRMKQYDVKRPGLFQLSLFNPVVIRSMHSKILFCAAQEWSGSGSRVLLKEYSTCLLPYMLTMCLLVTKVFFKSLQCVCLLPVSLKSLQLVAKLSLKSLQCVCMLPKCQLKASQMRGHWNTCHQSPYPKCPFFVTKRPHVWNNPSPFTV